jgi:antitoxin ParD1/3/4
MLTTVVNQGRLGDVSRNTMSFALPEEMREYVDARVRSGDYGNTSEYLRDLIRRDREQQAAERVRQLVVAGLESGEARPLTESAIDELRDRAFGEPG